MKDTGKILNMSAELVPPVCRFKIGEDPDYKTALFVRNGCMWYESDRVMLPIDKESIVHVNATEYALSICMQILETLPAWVQYIRKTSKGIVYAESDLGYQDVEVDLDPWPEEECFTWRVELC